MHFFEAPDGRTYEVSREGAHGLLIVDPDTNTKHSLVCIGEEDHECDCGTPGCPIGPTVARAYRQRYRPRWWPRALGEGAAARVRRELVPEAGLLP